MRRSGILLHISSLPGPGCTGAMGEEAYAFVDFLAAGGQSVWQVLPLNPPFVYHSPYSAYSVFAGNPAFIDLRELEEEGLLPRGSFAATGGGQEDRVDFAACDKKLLPLLRRAYAADFRNKEEEIRRFREEQSYWLEDYALYMAVRTKQGDISYLDWPANLSQRRPEAMIAAQRQLAEQIQFWIYVQYLFFRQWKKLKAYANSKGISILGDVPIYTASGSADVWTHTQVFLLDSRRRPTLVAGVPPDIFSADGQKWGNPLYNWDYLRDTGYEWWLQRLKVAGQLYDGVRIDHFRALDEYYAIPADSPTAREGSWLRGPGIDFMDAVKKAMPGFWIIAEDLGIITDSVRNLLRSSELPGMSVLLFAFSPRAHSAYLPHNHIRDSVAYIGTHDNDTALGWMEGADPREVEFATRYLNLNREEGLHLGWMRGLLSSVADTAILQMQDLLALDNSARMNVPATIGNNWAWRLRPHQVTPELAEQLRELTERYGRLPG